MVIIGVDAHKFVHQALAVDPAGKVLASWRGSNTAADWAALHAWSSALPAPRQWGIEGAWNYGRGLAQFLLARNETVFEVNPRWTAASRRRSRRLDKSDPLDARAVT
jgi:transposase